MGLNHLYLLFYARKRIILYSYFLQLRYASNVCLCLVIWIRQRFFFTLFNLHITPIPLQSDFPCPHITICVIHIFQWATLHDFLGHLFFSHLFSLFLSLSLWSNQSAFCVPCHVMGSLLHHSTHRAHSSTSWKRPSVQSTCRIFPFCGQFCINTVKGIWVSLILQCISGSIPVFPPCVCCGEVGDSMDRDWKRVAVFLLFVNCVNCSGTGKTDNLLQR